MDRFIATRGAGHDEQADGGGDVTFVHRPHRDDDVAAWLKRKRDELRAASALDFSSQEKIAYDWMARGVNDLLDRYRECADYGLTLRPEDDHRGDP